MHGREEGENRKQRRHMWSVPLTTTVASVDSNGSDNYFFKDGRRISVGDCALFKPLQDSPPFLGLVRCLTSDKEDNLRLSVNWLYRPVEVKLGKGVVLEVAPNEVFYSFHRDEIPTASLLHPCKVAFLPKGVELLAGVSSFVCRRVYDITNKCLWWLADQDYINDMQEEIDQLLHKTRIEMHATVQKQQGARSPKPVNGAAATSPLKHSPDSMQHSSTNLPQTKGKKRERGDQSSEPTKKERCVRADTWDAGQLRSESMLKLETAKITDRGGLVDSEAVERLVQLMQPEKSERKIDLAGRSCLAGIIAATDRLDCLSHFVQLRGLPILDEWLQDFHKGRIGDLGNVKDSNKSVEDFLLVLLHALDKLPVNLNALQMCNIGKSVNLLRSHKNSEIHKKARSLVDTWKKRVEAEINSNDAKYGSSQAVPWAGRSRHGGSHGGNGHSSAASEATIRSSVTHHSSLKSASVKLVPGDSSIKSAYAGGAKSAVSPTLTTMNHKGGQSRMPVNGGSSEPAQAVAREEKSSSSSQSHTNSQCSSDHAKNIVLSMREDARSSTARSRSSNKITGSGSKPSRSANGLQGAVTSNIQRESAPTRSSSMARISVVEKVSHPINANVASVPEENNHKLIVKIPNRGYSPVQSVPGGVVEDSACRNSRASSPALPEKHDQSDAYSGGKHDSHQSNDVDGSLTAVHCGTSNGTRKLPNVSEAAYSLSRNETLSRKSFDSSLSSIDALIESCVKFSETSAPMSADDDVGMNLLASVAAGEISKSDVSPVVSPHRNSTAVDNSCNNCNGNQKQLHGDDVSQQHSQSSDVADADKHNIVRSVSKVNDADISKTYGSAIKDLHQNGEGYLKSNGKLDEHGAASLHVASAGDGCCKVINEMSVAVEDESHNQLPVATQGLNSSLAAEDEVNDDVKINVSQGTRSSNTLEHNSLALASESESGNTNENPVMAFSGKDRSLAAEDSNEVKSQKADGADLCDVAGQGGNAPTDHEKNCSVIPQKLEESVRPSAEMDQNRCKDENVENNEALANQLGSSGTPVSSSTVAPLETEGHLTTEGSELTAVGVEKIEDSVSATGNIALSSDAKGSDMDVKLRFDLNEGFDMDDVKNGDPVCSGPWPPSACSVSPLQIPVSSASAALPASVTAAKGPFVPPDNLLRNKSELGWKGSAATSAFRPAEPRKVAEASPGPSKALLSDAPSCKQAQLPLDIDLNVADERILLDFGCQTSGQESNFKTYRVSELTTTPFMHCSGGLDLDLNKVDEAPDVGQHSASYSHRLGFSALPVKPSPSIISSDGEVGGRRDFDLNDGPATDEMPTEQTSYYQHARGNIPLQPSFLPRINSSDAGNCFSWYPPGTSYSVSVTPSALPHREAFPIVGMGGGQQRAMGGPTSSLSFNPDVYRGSVLSSSPAMPFPSAPFQYPVFPLGTSFPLPTSTLSVGSSGYMDPGGGRISAIPSQLVGTAAAVPFQYPHAYVLSRPVLDVANKGVIESNNKWGKQGLDLNYGPGGLDTDGKDESLPVVSRQPPVIGSQPLAEELARVYTMAGGVLKRKEPEGGWNMDMLNFKQSSWR